eukprot:g31118.t1
MGNIEAIRYIHRNHPHSIHTYDETGQMPLHHAVCKGHKDGRRRHRWRRSPDDRTSDGEHWGQPAPAWAVREVRSRRSAVTDPKNQGKCGSCWSFSTSGALEGAWKIATGKLISLSEQQLVDCAKNGPPAERSGDSYPYLAKQGTCHQTKCTVGVPKGSIVGFKDVSSKDMNALMQAVSKQPVSVAIEADQMAFQLYKGNKLDHGVLLVGYGTENGVDYWKVKNSWGASWGENGYIRLERGVPGDGECGIKDQPSYPLVKAKTETELGNAEVVRLLLDNGADLHAREKFVGGTPLHHAALHGRTNVVNVLLERSPDLEALNRKRQTPLHVASLYGHLDTAKILLEKGANAEAKDIRGCTPANLANKTGHEDMENLLC